MCSLLPKSCSLLLYLDHPSAISVDSSSSREPSVTPPVREKSPFPRALSAPGFLHQNPLASSCQGRASLPTGQRALEGQGCVRPVPSVPEIRHTVASL